MPGELKGAGDLKASGSVVYRWNNGSTEESLDEIKRVVDELRASMLAQGIQISQLRPIWQQDDAQVKEQIMTDDVGNASAACIGFGILLVWIGSIM
jgi:hypothetical protein